MSGSEQDMNKFTPDGHNTNCVAETFVAVIYNQLMKYLFVLEKKKSRKSTG